MTNPINGINGTESASSNKVQKHLKDATQNDSSPKPDQGDLDPYVELTKSALQLREIERELSSSPAFDDAKVNKIKQAIEDGSYKIDSRSIAEKLINSDKTLP